MAGHSGAVVGVEEDDGVVGEAIVFQLFEDSSDLFVHGRHVIVEAGHGLADDRGIDVVRWKGSFGGVMNLILAEFALHLFLKLLIGPDHRATLVGSHEVEDAEEGLCLVRIASPVGVCAAFIPRGRDDPFPTAGVVIGFDVVGGVVAGLFPEDGGESAHEVRDGKGGAHLHGTQRGGVAAGDEAGSGGRADWGRGKGVGVAHAFLGESVEVGSGSVGVTVAAKGGTHVLSRDPEDVGRCGGGAREGEERGCEGEESGEAGHGMGKLQAESDLNIRKGGPRPPMRSRRN